MLGTFHNLLVTNESGIARVTLNRPERRNALSETMLAEMEAALQQIADDSSARVVILTASGSVFSSGHDLNEMVGRSEADYRSLFSRCSRVMQLLQKIPQPVLARVQGDTLAAGCQLVAACDLAVSVDSARFGTPGVKIGLFCTTPMVPLVRTIAPKAAMEMLLTGIPISAGRALALGLINRMVPAADLDSTVQDLVTPIIAASPMVVALGKKAFYDGLAMDLCEAYDQASQTMTCNAKTRDAQEGISAFLEKRRPTWSNE